MIALGPYIPRRVEHIRHMLEAIAKKLDGLDKIILGQTDIENYSLDTGEGSQRIGRRKMKEIYDMRERLEAEYQHWINEAYGIGLTNITLRRKNPC